MSQVGHADSKMTTDVYAQLQQRPKRDRGTEFDKLVRDAREQLRTPHETPREAPVGTEGRKQAPKWARRILQLQPKPAICRSYLSGRSRIRTWDLFLIREAL
jgi:hypothetical protein